MLSQIEDYFNKLLCSLLQDEWMNENSIEHPCLQNIMNDKDNFKFNFRPVLFNQDKRGHIYSTSLYNLIQKQNKYYHNKVEKQLEISNAVRYVTDHLNDLLKNSWREGEDYLLNKISHFSENKGVVSWFLSDKLAIQELVENTNEIINSDDEFIDKTTEDQDTLPVDSQESDDNEADVQMVDQNAIGTIESVFREVNGLPTQMEFVPKAFAKIVLHDTKFESVSEFIGENRYVWLQHKIQNEWIYTQEKDDEEQATEDLENPIIADDELTWTLALVESFNETTIYISGPGIIHDTPIFDIKGLESNQVLNFLKSQASPSSFKLIIAEKLLSKNDLISSPEDIVNEEIEKRLQNMKSIFYTDSVMNDLTTIVEQGKLEFYSSVDEVLSILNLTLSMEPIWLLTQTKSCQKNLSAIAFDNLMVIYEKVGEQINILKLIWNTRYIETGAPHTKQWLDALCSVLV